MAEQQTNIIVKVEWEQSNPGEDTFGQGTLTVSTALGAACTVFVAHGLVFQINYAPPGGTTLEFTYTGRMTVREVASLLKPGDVIILNSH
jgi:hypothetical protein